MHDVERKKERKTEREIGGKKETKEVSCYILRLGNKRSHSRKRGNHKAVKEQKRRKISSWKYLKHRKKTKRKRERKVS